MSELKKKITEREIPSEFDESTVKIIKRIEHNANVVGVMYFRNDFLQLCTVPESMTQVLSRRLPSLGLAFKMAVRNIDVIDELVAYRIEINKIEIMVVAQKELNICVVHKISNKKKVSKNKKKTAFINNINPIVDRIIEDDSVEGVIMTNEEGVPVLTNINLNGATSYGLAMKRLGQMTRISTMEIDPFDDVLVLRLITRKIEMMVVPHSKFNIIVIQHARNINKKHAELSKDKTANKY